jgi:hypothetical protein
MKNTGIKDKNGIEIFEGNVIIHNCKEFLIKWSKNRNELVARILNDEGMNWRDMDWLSRVSKYIEVKV